jgi:hypothetical protein
LAGSLNGSASRSPRSPTTRPACAGAAFVEPRREHRTVLNRIADPRVYEMLDLADTLLADNAEHGGAWCRIDDRS